MPATATHPPAAASSITAGGEADALLTRLEWTVLRRLDGLLHGDYRTVRRGPGVDLADLREYQYHDDARHIDWNVTARMQVPYLREYHEDRELAAWFALDLSASADFGSAAFTKRTLAARFVGLLARTLSRRGNRVGMIRYGTAVDAVLPPRGGRRQVLRLIDAVLSPRGPRAANDERARPRPAAEAASAGTATDLRQLLGAAQRMLRRRSLLFVVSDFYSLPGWQRPLGELAQRHEVVVVRLADPLESALPDLGAFIVEDAETGQQLFVDTADAGFRRRYAAIAARRDDELRAQLAGAGVDTLELSTADDLADTVLRYAELRRRRGVGRSPGRLPAHLAAAGAVGGRGGAPGGAASGGRGDLSGAGHRAPAIGENAGAP